MLNQSPIYSSSLLSDNNNNVPHHVIDPFDLNESLAVGVATIIAVVSVHIFLLRLEKKKKNNSVGGSFRIFLTTSASASSADDVNTKSQPSLSSSTCSNSSFIPSSSSSSSSLPLTMMSQVDKDDEDEEYRARIISFLHAAISSVGSAYALNQHLVVDNGGGSGDDGSSSSSSLSSSWWWSASSSSCWLDTRPATRLEADWQMFSFAYFACDTVMMLYSFMAYYYCYYSSSSSPSSTRQGTSSIDDDDDHGDNNDGVSSKERRANPLLLLRRPRPRPDETRRLMQNRFQKKKSDVITFLVHHCIAMASLACGGFFGIYGPIVCAAQLAGEISNPFMHLRWLLNADGHRDTFFCRVFCTRLWYVSFFVSRIVVCPYLACFAMKVMHPVFWPQVWLMIIFSGKFIWDAFRADRRGEWWTG